MSAGDRAPPPEPAAPVPAPPAQPFGILIVCSCGGGRGSAGFDQRACRRGDVGGGQAGRGGERGGVGWLDAVEVDDPRRDALVAERVGGGEAVVQGDAGPDEGDLV